MSLGAKRRRLASRVYHAPELAEVTPEPRRGRTEVVPRPEVEREREEPRG